MSEWEGWLVEKRYYKATVEADDWEDAKSALSEASIDHSAPHYIDWEVYDIKEVV